MRSIFLVCAFVVMGLSIVCIFISLSQKKRISKYMARLHLMAVVSTVFATVPLFTTDLTVATLSISLYYACIDWYLFAFVDFLFSSKELHKSISLAHNSSIDICLIVVCLTAVCLGALYHTILSIARGKIKKFHPLGGRVLGVVTAPCGWSRPVGKRPSRA